MSKSKRNPADETARLEMHARRISEGEMPVVFCVKCGSTLIDQNFIDELRCYDCGNTLKWDGTRFSINRYLVMGKDAREKSIDSMRTFNAFPAGPAPEEDEP